MLKVQSIIITLMVTASAQAQQLPKYLDETVPVEQRIDDALSRMTLDEKIAVIHAQSKFSSPGVKRLQRLVRGIPCTDLSGCYVESRYGQSLWLVTGRRGTLS